MLPPEKVESVGLATLAAGSALHDVARGIGRLFRRDAARLGLRLAGLRLHGLERRFRHTGGFDGGEAGGHFPLTRLDRGGAARTGEQRMQSVMREEMETNQQLELVYIHKMCLLEAL